MKIRGNTVGTNIKPDKFNPLPPITDGDEGKVLVVENGALVFKVADETVGASLNEINTLLGGE